MSELFSASATLSAMALNILNHSHPNKMPFSGILTRVDQPSDAAPDGSNGKLITISAEAATNALSSLLGMAVDYKPNLDGHDPKAKIGIITAATVVGDAIHIEGFLYANDFPEVAAEIKANKDILGFSYEARNLYTNDPTTDPVVITECTFTGAAILRKDKAAYKTTSIHASTEEKDIMSPELEAILKGLAEKMEALSASNEEVKQLVADKIDANAKVMSLVEPHAKACDACAAGMEAAGVGADPNNGHQVALRKIAGHMRASAAQGKVPHIYRDHDYGVNANADTNEPVKKEDDTDMDLQLLLDKIAAMSAEFKAEIADLKAAQATQIADLKAQAFQNSVAPVRKTADAATVQLLAKAGLEAPTDGGKVSVAVLDKALVGMDMDKRLQFKSQLRVAGLLD